MRPARCAGLNGGSPWVERPATLFIGELKNMQCTHNRIHYCCALSLLKASKSRKNSDTQKFSVDTIDNGSLEIWPLAGIEPR